MGVISTFVSTVVAMTSSNSEPARGGTGFRAAVLVLCVDDVVGSQITARATGIARGGVMTVAAHAQALHEACQSAHRGGRRRGPCEDLFLFCAFGRKV